MPIKKTRKSLKTKSKTRKNRNRNRKRLVGGGSYTYTLIIDYEILERVSKKPKPRPTGEEVKSWYADRLEMMLDFFEYNVTQSSVSESNNTITIVFTMNMEIDPSDLKIHAEMIADPDDDGNYPIRGYGVMGTLKKIYIGDETGVKKEIPYTSN
jgi:hypothetical protein